MENVEIVAANYRAATDEFERAIAQAKRIAREQFKRGQSPAAIARTFGITRQNVMYWLHGKARTPRAKHYRKNNAVTASTVTAGDAV